MDLKQTFKFSFCKPDAKYGAHSSQLSCIGGQTFLREVQNRLSKKLCQVETSRLGCLIIDNKKSKVIEMTFQVWKLSVSRLAHSKQGCAVGVQCYCTMRVHHQFYFAYWCSLALCSCVCVCVCLSDTQTNTHTHDDTTITHRRTFNYNYNLQIYIFYIISKVKYI